MFKWPWSKKTETPVFCTDCRYYEYNQTFRYPETCTHPDVCENFDCITKKPHNRGIARSLNGDCHCKMYEHRYKLVILNKKDLKQDRKTVSKVGTQRITTKAVEKVWDTKNGRSD
jgi:hypothetical protein